MESSSPSKSRAISAKVETVPWVVHELLAHQPTVSTADVVALTGLTRQGVHHHLKQMVDTGELEAIGGGRGRRYSRRALARLELETHGLMEDKVWAELQDQLPQLSRMNENATRIATYAFTEMLNNAVDHSGSETVRVSISDRSTKFVFIIEDDGIGAFEHVRRKKGLEDDVAAIQEISKGKMTTDPQRHTGEGIFFTSKAVDFFVLSSNGWRWFVDNVRQDVAIGRGLMKRGTQVWLEINPETDRVLRKIFDEYVDSDTHAFSRTRTVVRLFDYGVPFVSRSEAKRLARNLDRFEEVVVDFQGMDEVGQGFADELFRVWQSQHPRTRLIPVEMGPAVELMVRHALSSDR